MAKKRRQRSNKKGGEGNDATGQGSGRTSDSRFAAMASDPRFRRMPRRERKVQIDKRFKGMFDDERFSVGAFRDGRGNKVRVEQGAELKRFYEIEEDKDEEKHVRAGREDAEEGSGGSSSSSDDSSSDAGQPQNSVAQRARGLIVQRSDSEESTSSDSEDDFAALDVDWDGTGTTEFVEDVPTAVASEGAARRFVVVNLDWSRITSTDLLVMFQSFLDGGRVVENVTVYPSDFGVEKMKEEERLGPQGIWKDEESSGEANKKEANKGAESSDDDDDDDDEDEDDDDDDDEGNDNNDEEGEQQQDTAKDEPEEQKPTHANSLYDFDSEPDSDAAFDQEKLREYEKQRLRYYYAVVTCDSVETAQHLYNECDGMEFERSSNILDLRFVPDEVEFNDHPPRDSASEVPHGYTAPDFFTSALQLTKVSLTWEGDDPVRTKKLQREFTEDDIRQLDLEAYLGSGSEDSEGEGTDAVISMSESDSSDDDSDGGDGEKKKRKKVKLKRRARNRYAALLEALKTDADADDEEEEQEQADEDGDVVMGEADEVAPEQDAESKKQKKKDKKSKKKKKKKKKRKRSMDDVGFSSSVGDLEIVFEPGLREVGQDILAKSQEAQKERERVDETVWERHLRERREKRKARRRARKEKQKRKKQGLPTSSDEDDEGETQTQTQTQTQQEAPVAEGDSLFDDDIDMPMDDPFFSQDVFGSEYQPRPGQAKKESKKKDKKPKRKTEQEKAEEEAERATLELLMMREHADDDSDPAAGQGFDLDELVLRNKQRKALEQGQNKRVKRMRRSNKAKKFDLDKEDNFEIDTEDPRFSSLFSKPEFHIDPTHPSYRPTEGTEKLVTERQKRQHKRKGSSNGSGSGPTKKKRKGKKLKEDLQQLVDKFKRRS